MIANQQQSNDENPCKSTTGKRLYDMIFRKRQQQLALAERINDYAEKAQNEEKALEAKSLEEDSEKQEQATIPACPKPEGNVVKFPLVRTSRLENDIGLLDLLDWYQHKEENAVVGQENALIKITLKAIMLDSFALEGPAGGGKTHILKALASVIPEDKIYWHEFGTDAAFFNNADEINKRQILVIPEYQKILKSCPQVKEVIKTLTEGRIAKREKSAPDGTIKQYVIYPKCVITSIADENEFKETLEKDKEDMRRFSHIKLDSSDSTIQKIREYKRQKRSMRPELMRVADNSLGERIKAHLADCIDFKLEAPPLDPFVNYMDQYLPETRRSSAYIDDYYSYLDGCAKFHFRQRMLKDGREARLVLDLADHYVVYQVYHKEFCDTLLKLDNLEDFGDKGKKVHEPVNWAACFEAGVAKMKENYPPVVVEKWIARQLTNKKLIVPDIAKKEEVVLFEYE